MEPISANSPLSSNLRLKSSLPAEFILATIVANHT